MSQKNKYNIFVKAGFKPSQRRYESGRWVNKWAAMRHFENGIRNQDFESAGVYDEDGNLVFKKDGEAEKVGFSKAEQDRMRGTILTHNHPFPGSGGLSSQDLASGLSMGIKSIKSVDKDGNWMEAVFDYDYIKNISKQIAAENNIWPSDVNIGGAVNHAADLYLEEMKINDSIFNLSLMMVQDKNDMSKVNNNFAKKILKDVYLGGYKEMESMWAPLELDKLWTIKTGRDEI